MEEESPEKVCGLYSGPEPGVRQGVTSFDGTLGKVQRAKGKMSYFAWE